MKKLICKKNFWQFYHLEFQEGDKYEQVLGDFGDLEYHKKMPAVPNMINDDVSFLIMEDGLRI